MVSRMCSTWNDFDEEPRAFHVERSVARAWGFHVERSDSDA